MPCDQRRLSPGVIDSTVYVWYVSRSIGVLIVNYNYCIVHKQNEDNKRNEHTVEHVQDHM